MPYWHESNAYTVTSDEVYEMEASVRLLMEMLVEAGDYIIESNLFSQMGIPGWAVPRIKETWESEPPMLYGRFDFAYGPEGFKLLEYNADTPTALVETAVQWHWVQDVYGAGGDQWNMVHELLVQRWKELAPRLPGDRIYLLHTKTEKSGEDFMTVGYMVETAREAGLTCELMPVERIGLHPHLGFVDDLGRSIRTVFKLYPWEWMIHEDFADEALRRMGDEQGETLWIEPIWKMMWSNKGILPVLHRLFPENPHVLPAWFDGEQPDSLKTFVRKPLLAREGANAVVVRDGDVVEEGPDQGYGGEGYVVQEYAELGDYGAGGHPVLGVWTVDVEPAGLGIRESDGLLTTNTSRFVPHVIA
jgi:glutathionylspermidine synthase